MWSVCDQVVHVGVDRTLLPRVPRVPLPQHQLPLLREPQRSRNNQHSYHQLRRPSHQHRLLYHHLRKIIYLQYHLLVVPLYLLLPQLDPRVDHQHLDLLRKSLENPRNPLPTVTFVWAMQERIKKLVDQRNWSLAVIAVAQVSSRRKSNASIHAEQIIINHIDIFSIIVLVASLLFPFDKHSDLTNYLI